MDDNQDNKPENNENIPQEELNQDQEQAAEQNSQIAEENNIPETNPGEMELDTKGKQGKLTAPKSVILKLLMRHPFIIVIVAVILVIIVFGIVASFEATDADKYLYVENKITKVSVTYHPYGTLDDSGDVTTTYDLEDYIKKAVYMYTKDFSNVGSAVYDVYFSLAVALRTEIIMNNGKITFREQLTSSIPSNEVMELALTDSYGLVMTDVNTGQYVTSKSSRFCWLTTDFMKNHMTSDTGTASASNASNDADNAEDNEDTETDDAEEESAIANSQVVASQLVDTDQTSIVTSQVADANLNKDKYTIYQANKMNVTREFSEYYIQDEVYTKCQCNQYSGEAEECGSDDDNSGEPAICWYHWKVNVGTEEKPDYIYYREWKHVEEETGYSLYGAYYLQQQYGYSYSEILQYFYGVNIKLQTIYKDDAKSGTTTNSSASCSSFNMTSTTLSRDNFIAKVNAYNYSSDSSSKKAAWNLFKDNAGKIYDMGISSGVNPEFVFVRAVIEGFSPGVSKNNYWGIHCLNTEADSCNSYASLDEGVQAYLNILKAKNGDYNSLMQGYAYLGSYWYNPGGSGLGGCYYKSYVEKYITDADAISRIEEACSSSHSGCTASSTSSCVATSDVDKQGYIDYQKSIMASFRQKIFGIASDNCSNNSLSSGSCVIYKQGDSQWNSFQLGTGSSTIGNAGCALSSLAIALTCTGKLTVDTSTFSPKVLNDAMVSSNCMAGSNIGNWSCPVFDTYVPGFTYHKDESITDFKSDSDDSKKEELSKYLNQENTIVIIQISNSAHSTHFMVLKSINDDNTIVTLDPGTGSINQTYILGDVKGTRIYTY